MNARSAVPNARALTSFRRSVLRFYRRRGRALPWRRTRDPYRILVSEIMLQQTQADRVRTKYLSFLRRFPTLHVLARAPLDDVVRAWIGLGYNSRAVRLWKCAKKIIADYGGIVPRDPSQLVRLPGVGPYTASAVAAIAFGAHVPVVDVNVARVLTRALTGREQQTRNEVQLLAARALPTSSAGTWAQALMDVGAAYCRSRPQCAGCPVRPSCAFARRGKAAALRPGQSTTSASARFIGSRRYHRGRIVGALALHGRLTLAALGGQVKEGFALSDLPWLRDLLSDLARDGLVRIQGDHARLP